MRRDNPQPPAQTPPASPPSPTSPENPADPLACATGTHSPDLAMKLLREVVGNQLRKIDATAAAAPAVPADDDENALKSAKAAATAAESRAMAAALAALAGIAPRDAMEGMLAAQMVAVHDAAMDRLHDATDPYRPVPCREADARLAARLMTLYGRHMDLLDRRRGRIAVGRVQVEPGGQAIVGTVNLRGRGGERE